MLTSTSNLYLNLICLSLLNVLEWIFWLVIIMHIINGEILPSSSCFMKRYFKNYLWAPILPSLLHFFVMYHSENFLQNSKVCTPLWIHLISLLKVWLWFWIDFVSHPLRLRNINMGIFFFWINTVFCIFSIL